MNTFKAGNHNPTAKCSTAMGKQVKVPNCLKEALSRRERNSCLTKKLRKRREPLVKDIQNVWI